MGLKCTHYYALNRYTTRMYLYCRELHSTFCKKNIVVVVQSLSHVQLFATPWTAARQASPSFTISQSLLKRICIESVMPSNDLILIPFSSCQSFPTPRGSLVSRLFTPVDQSIQASASASVLPVIIEG